MRKRRGFAETIRITRRVIAEREVFTKAYEFTVASASAQQVIDALERYCGRTVPTADAAFYVATTIYGQQVILNYGNEANPEVFSARIDFEPGEPATGVLWFFGADVYAAGTEAAEYLRANLAWLIEKMAPGSVLVERTESVVIASTEPGPKWRERRGAHRRNRDG